ncbi:hypothetical protein WJX74_007193 [Apatococcus lobatus]|uniref:Uncharacterized protein n=1 Tax=Apatococcus lobatus TaxID=904363 RepID=A0AAW1R1Y2_9CHLO
MPRAFGAEGKGSLELQKTVNRASAHRRQPRALSKPHRTIQKDQSAFTPAQALSAALGAVAASQLLCSSAANALPDTRNAHQPTLSVERAWIESYLLQDAHDRLAEMPDKQLLHLFQQALRHEHPDLIEGLGSSEVDRDSNPGRLLDSTGLAAPSSDKHAGDQPGPSSISSQPAAATAANPVGNSKLSETTQDSQSSTDSGLPPSQQHQAGAQPAAQSPGPAAGKNAIKQAFGIRLPFGPWQGIPLPELPRMPDGRTSALELPSTLADQASGELERGGAPQQGSASPGPGSEAARPSSNTPSISDQSTGSTTRQDQGPPDNEDQDEVDETSSLLLSQAAADPASSQGQAERDGGSGRRPAGKGAAGGWAPALQGLQLPKLPSSGAVMAGAAQVLPPTLAVGAAAVLAKALWDLVDWTGDGGEDESAAPQNGTSIPTKAADGARARPTDPAAPTPDQSPPPSTEPPKQSQAILSGRMSPSNPPTHQAVESPGLPFAELLRSDAKDGTTSAQRPSRQHKNPAVQAAAAFWESRPHQQGEGLRVSHANSSLAESQDDPAWTTAEARVSPAMLQQMTSGGSAGGGGVLWRRTPAPESLHSQSNVPENKPSAGSVPFTSPILPSEQAPGPADEKYASDLSAPVSLAGDQTATGKSVDNTEAGPFSSASHIPQSRALLSNLPPHNIMPDLANSSAGASRTANQQAQQHRAGDGRDSHGSQVISNSASMQPDTQHAQQALQGNSHHDGHETHHPDSAPAFSKRAVNMAFHLHGPHQSAPPDREMGRDQEHPAADKQGSLQQMSGHDMQRPDPWQTPVGWDHSPPTSQGARSGVGASNNHTSLETGSSNQVVPFKHGSPAFKSESNSQRAARARQSRGLLDNCE